MFLLRFIRFVFLTPAIIIPVSFLFGGMFVRVVPHFERLVDYTYGLWDADYAPIIVGVVSGVLLLVAVLDLFRGLHLAWKEGAPARAELKAKKAADARDIQDRILAANKRREEADYRSWAETRIKPWRGILERANEVGLVSEIEAMFAARKDSESTIQAERRHDLEIMKWLVEKSVCFYRADPVANATKIHTFIDHALGLAGKHNAWLALRSVPHADIVVGPVFAGQRAIYVPDSGMPHTSREFVGFLAWLVVANVPKATVVVAP